MTCKYKVKIKDIQYNYKVQMTDIQSKYKFKVFCTGYDDSEIKEKIDAMYQAWPKVSGEGETITLNDTANTTMAIDLKGNTSQETTTGINKIKLVDKSSTTTGGVTYNINNQVLTLSGTSTGVNILIDFNDITLPAGTYYFYLLRTKTTRVDISLRTKNNAQISSANFGNAFQNTLSNKAFTLSTDTLMHSMNLWFPSGVDATDNYKVMICTASHTASEYEKYTGENPAPNPDYPQTISNVTGTNTIKIVGKNLFDISKVERNVYYNYGTTESVPTIATSDKRITLSPTNSIKVKPSTQYTLSFPSAFRYAIAEMENNYISLGDSGWKTNTTYTFTTSATTNYIGFNFSKTDNSTITDNDWNTFINSGIQLEENSTDTPYEAYQEQNCTINLGSIELCKIDTYKDRIYPLNDKWYLEKKIGKVVLDGSEYWYNAGGNAPFGLEITDSLITISNDIPPLVYCDKFYPVSQSATWSVYDSLITASSISTSTKIIRIRYTSISGLENFKTWLSTHNTEVYYVLATPTTEEITDSTLISQLEEIKEAESYSGQTNISQTNDDKPFILTATALKDLSSL